MNQTYKLLQLQNYFLSEYDYDTFASLDTTGDDIMMFRDDEKYKYNLIILSLNSADNYSTDTYHRNHYSILANRLLKGKDPKILYLYINKNSYYPSIMNVDYGNIDEDYYDGVDLKDIFPDIKNIVHNAEDAEKEIDHIEDLIVDATEKKMKLNMKLNSSKSLCISILIGICCLVYILELIISRNYSESSTYIILGALYKTFAIGLKQVYRLITYSFVHGGLIHLICNMMSLFLIGRSICISYGAKNTLFILFNSILIGGLTQLILFDNQIALGMSAGIYGLFMVYVLTAIKTKLTNIYVLLPVIIINIALNFLSTTAWAAHIGGIIGGLLSYFIISKKGNEKTVAIILFAVLIIALFIKLFMANTVTTVYAGTDLEVVQFFSDIGLKNYSNSLLTRLMAFYSQIGG